MVAEPPGNHGLELGDAVLGFDEARPAVDPNALLDPFADEPVAAPQPACQLNVEGNQIKVVTPEGEVTFDFADTAARDYYTEHCGSDFMQRLSGTLLPRMDALRFGEIHTATKVGPPDFTAHFDAEMRRWRALPDKGAEMRTYWARALRDVHFKRGVGTGHGHGYALGDKGGLGDGHGDTPVANQPLTPLKEPLKRLPIPNPLLPANPKHHASRLM